MAQVVHVTADLAAPPERVFEHLAQHANLGALFGASSTTVRQGEGHPNGLGSVRRMRPFPGAPAFEETITEFVPHRRIVYRITRGTPLDDHEGVLTFTPRDGGGTHVDYRIRLGAPVPGVAWLVAQVLGARLRRSLPALDLRA